MLPVFIWINSIIVFITQIDIDRDVCQRKNKNIQFGPYHMKGGYHVGNSNYTPNYF
jgi:hypothetical protein